MPSDVSTTIPPVSLLPPAPARPHDRAAKADPELSIGTAAFRFVAMLVVTLASAVAMSGFEPMELATVVGLL